MKKDITTRLRDDGNELNLPRFVRGDCCEGADEIERLRREIEELRQSRDRWRSQALNRKAKQ